MYTEEAVSLTVLARVFVKSSAMPTLSSSSCVRADEIRKAG